MFCFVNTFLKFYYYFLFIILLNKIRHYICFIFMFFSINKILFKL